jgi:hypothetical protein
MCHPSSLIPFRKKRAVLWRFNVACNNTTYVGRHVNCLILANSGMFRQIFIIARNIKFHINPSRGSRADTCAQTYELNRFTETNFLIYHRHFVL